MKLAAILPHELAKYDARWHAAIDGTVVIEVRKAGTFGPDATAGTANLLEAAGEPAGRLIHFGEVHG